MERPDFGRELRNIGLISVINNSSGRITEEQFRKLHVFDLT
jgi:hypothetical protein